MSLEPTEEQRNRIASLQFGPDPYTCADVIFREVRDMVLEEVLEKCDEVLAIAVNESANPHDEDCFSNGALRYMRLIAAMRGTP